MAQVFKPLLTNTMKKPAMATWRHSIRRRGMGLPLQILAMSASTLPAVTKRIPENSAGGRLATAILVNKKLEPHTRYMVLKASMSFAEYRGSRKLPCAVYAGRPTRPGAGYRP